MYNNYISQNYLETEVTAADPLKLVRLLYQGALDAVGEARTCIQNHDISGRSRRISKATLILNELALNLDHSKGAEISRSLGELYDYMIRRLNDANFQQMEAPLVEVQALLRTLLEAWEGLAPAKESARPDYAPESSDYQPLSCTA